MVSLFLLKETTPTEASWCLMKQAEDKIPLNTVRDKGKKKTCSVTPVELGKYRAASQSAAKNIPYHCKKERD